MNEKLNLNRNEMNWFDSLARLLFPDSIVARRVCKYVYVHGGFSVEYSSIQAYTEAIHRQPSAHHQFLACRAKWIKMKIDNPLLQLRGKDDLQPAKQVSLEEAQDC